ncbi:MAG: SDR family oxidoreductase [Pseudomonadota bacterium]|nr:SDR family oxidoreductase [Pseudomonadota bacterium]
MSETRTPSPPYPPNEDQQPPGSEHDLDPRPRYHNSGYRAADKLAGQKVLITGGDSGIGRAVAVLFAREGADIAIVYLPEEQADADETRMAVEQYGRSCLCIAGDVSDENFCRQAVARVVETLGGLDVLINNAAFQNHVEAIEKLTAEQWDRTFRTNIYGYFWMVKAAVPHLPEGGAIIQTGSKTGLEGSPGLLDYSATKGAIHAFTKSLAAHLVDRGIRVNCVAPGPVWTPLNPAERSAEQTRTFGEKTAYGRPAQPWEIAPTYVFLANNSESAYITGEVIACLGGETRAG